MNTKTNQNFMQRPTIVFGGTIGAGKTTASKYIIDKYSYIHLSYVDLIWLPILKERGIFPSRKALQDLGDELRERHGIRELAKMILPFIPIDDPAVIDDVRHPEAYAELKKCLSSNIRLVFIKTETLTRVPRLKLRDNLSSVEELMDIEKRETEVAISGLEPMADFTIINNSGLEEFYHEIDECMKNIMG